MMFFNKDPLNVVEDALKRRGIRYVRVSRDTILIGFGSQDANFLILVTHEDTRKTLVFMLSPLREPIGALQAIAAGGMPVMRVHASAGHSASQVAKVCEYLLDTNYRMLLGSLERDASDGEIRLRIAFPYRDSMPTEEQVGWCLEIGMSSLLRVTGELSQLLGTNKPMEV